MVAVAGECMKKARRIAEHEKYDNKITGFPGDRVVEPHVFLMNKNAHKHVMSH